MWKLVCFFTLFFSCSALAENYYTKQEGGVLKFYKKDGPVAGMKDVYVGKMTTLPKGTAAYHWGDEENISRVVKRGRIDQGEMDFLINNPQDMKAGGGYYVSLDRFDSKNYGTTFNVVDIPSDANIVECYDGAVYRDPEFIRFIKTQNAKGIKYKSTWINIFDIQPLSNIHAPDLVKDVYPYRDHYFSFSSGDIREYTILNLEYGPLVDHELVNKSNPLVGKLIRGEKIDAEGLKTIFDYAYAHADGGAAELMYDSPFVRNIRAAFKDVDVLKILSLGPEKINNKTFCTLTYLGLSPQKIFPGVVFPNALAGVPLLDREALKTYRSETAFGEKLKKAFLYSDYDDLLKAFSEGKPEPWAIYDEIGYAPFSKKWADAQAVLKWGTWDMADITNANGIMGGGKFRSYELFSSGSIDRNGKKFMRINLEQKKRLEGNRFLTSEIIKDSDGSYLARFEYPSAKNYMRFKSDLSPSLLSELQAKAGQLQNTGSVAFNEMTSKINAELSSKIGSVKELASVMPYEKFNAQTIKLLAKQWKSSFGINGDVFIRNTENLVFIESENELAAFFNTGKNNYEELKRGLLKAVAEDPKFPRYYDVPEIWQIGADVETLPKNKGAFVAKMKEWYKTNYKPAVVANKGAVGTSSGGNDSKPVVAGASCPDAAFLKMLSQL